MTPASVLEPVSFIHSIASADVVFVVPVPTADERGTTTAAEVDIAMSVISSVIYVVST